MSEKVDFEFLKKHLWGAADDLRGSLDPSEYRQPIMTVLFLKRLNDVFVENAEKFTTLHPRCGTSFLFFLLFISIVLFSGVFAVVPIGKGLPLIPRHIVAVLFKIVLVFPIAGISYELIKLAGKYSSNPLSKLISLPGMMLQKLTTREPDREQLEVALASIKAVLQLEKQYNLEQADKKILTLEEIDIKDLSEIADTNANFKEFLE